MSTAVFVTRHADNHYTARALAFSDVAVTGNTEAEAIAHLRTALLDLQARSHVIHIDLPMPATSVDDPWLQSAGIWADDPSWDVFQQAIAEYRTAGNPSNS
jgi:hypothetical protein